MHSIGQGTADESKKNYIALKYHHFRLYVSLGLVKIEHVDTKEQVADIFTKALDEK